MSKFQIKAVEIDQDYVNDQFEMMLESEKVNFKHSMIPIDKVTQNFREIVRECF